MASTRCASEREERTKGEDSSENIRRGVDATIGHNASESLDSGEADAATEAGGQGAALAPRRVIGQVAHKRLSFGLVTG